MKGAKGVEVDAGGGFWACVFPSSARKTIRLLLFMVSRQHQYSSLTFQRFDGFEPLNIHFMHQQSDVEGTIPLLFCHGWPESFLEVTKILPLLTKGGMEHPVFHVIAPSLPNYGFSSGTKRKGFGLKQYAETCHLLMLKLRYENYLSQGGDWCTMITRILTLIHHEALMAHHINLPWTPA